MPRFERAALLERFHDMVRHGVPIIGGGAGIGLSAKCEEAGGIGLILARAAFRSLTRAPRRTQP